MDTTFSVSQRNKRLVEVRAQENAISKSNRNVSRVLIDSRKHQRKNDKIAAKKRELQQRYAELRDQFESTLVNVGNAHRNAGFDSYRFEMKTTEDHRKTKERLISAKARSNSAAETLLHFKEDLRQKTEAAERRNRNLDEIRRLEREEAQLFAENRGAKLKMMNQVPVDPRVKTTQSALSIVDRFPVNIAGVITRHVAGEGATIFNVAKEEERNTLKDSWAAVMHELLNRKKMKARAHTAQVEAVRIKGAKSIEDELKLLEATDKTGIRVERIRNTTNVPSPEDDDNRARSAFEKQFMSQPIHKISHSSVFYGKGKKAEAKPVKSMAEILAERAKTQEIGAQPTVKPPPTFKPSSYVPVPQISVPSNHRVMQRSNSASSSTDSSMSSAHPTDAFDLDSKAMDAVRRGVFAQAPVPPRYNQHQEAGDVLNTTGTTVASVDTATDSSSAVDESQQLEHPAVEPSRDELIGAVDEREGVDADSLVEEEEDSLIGDVRHAPPQPTPRQPEAMEVAEITIEHEARSADSSFDASLDGARPRRTPPIESITLVGDEKSREALLDEKLRKYAGWEDVASSIDTTESRGDSSAASNEVDSLTLEQLIPHPSQLQGQAPAPPAVRQIDLMGDSLLSSSSSGSSASGRARSGGPQPSTRSESTPSWGAVYSTAPPAAPVVRLDLYESSMSRSSKSDSLSSASQNASATMRTAASAQYSSSTPSLLPQPVAPASSAIIDNAIQARFAVDLSSAGSSVSSDKSSKYSDLLRDEHKAVTRWSDGLAAQALPDLPDIPNIAAEFRVADIVFSESESEPSFDATMQRIMDQRHANSSALDGIQREIREMRKRLLSTLDVHDLGDVSVSSNDSLRQQVKPKTRSVGEATSATMLSELTQDIRHMEISLSSSNASSGVSEDSIQLVSQQAPLTSSAAVGSDAAKPMVFEFTAHEYEFSEGDEEEDEDDPDTSLSDVLNNSFFSKNRPVPAMSATASSAPPAPMEMPTFSTREEVSRERFVRSSRMAVDPLTPYSMSKLSNSSSGSSGKKHPEPSTSLTQYLMSTPSDSQPTPVRTGVVTDDDSISLSEQSLT